MNEPILITGASRSGASMIAGILDICGAFSGKTASCLNGETKGMFENLNIKNTLVNPYLREIGCDDTGQFPLPNVTKLHIPVDWRERVFSLMKNEGMVNGQWFYKSPKSCLIWPVWAYAFPNAKWIIIRRKDDEIVHSCLKTTFMNAFNSIENQKVINAKDKEDAWYWWVREHNRRFVEMIEAGLNCKQIHPERMLNGDYSQIYEMLDWLGLKWDSRIPAYIEPKFFKVRNKK